MNELVLGVLYEFSVSTTDDGSTIEIIEDC